jgi:hypothetical protein
MAMTSFDKREGAFENKFAQDEEINFRANVRRNKLVGLWAAEKLGLSDADAESYANSVVETDLEDPGTDSVFQKIYDDFRDNGVIQSRHQIRRTMDEFFAFAVAELTAGN